MLDERIELTVDYCGVRGRGWDSDDTVTWVVQSLTLNEELMAEVLVGVVCGEGEGVECIEDQMICWVDYEQVDERTD